jgi:2'-5' RNA ligase
MSQEKDKYSLWIVPRGEAGEIIQSLVNTLANENGAPQFVPHLTLVANIFADASELEDVTECVKQCAEELDPFTIKTTSYGYLAEEFRCLYLLAESPQLQSVYGKMASQFPQVSEEHFQGMPHLSVLYGNYPEETKKQIIAANPIHPTEFVVDTFDLYLTNNSIKDWQAVHSFPLATTSAQSL